MTVGNRCLVCVVLDLVVEWVPDIMWGWKVSVQAGVVMWCLSEVTFGAYLNGSLM